MVNRPIIAAVFMATWTSFALPLCALDTIDGILYSGANQKNLFAGYPMPTKRSLRAASDVWPRIRMRRERDGQTSGYCRQELYVFKTGFRRIYPDAPQRGPGVLSSWVQHMEMVHFPDLYLCWLKIRLAEAIAEVQRTGTPIRRVVQRRNMITFDFSVILKDTRAVNAIYGVISDLVWMSYTGYAPAMFELATLGAKDRYIRLTPRFSYYLLTVATRAGVGGAQAERLLRIVAQHLTVDDRRQLDDRARTRKWPRSERMVLD